VERKVKTSNLATKNTKEKQKSFLGFKTLKTLLTLVVLEILASWWQLYGFDFLSNSPSQRLSVKNQTSLGKIFPGLRILFGSRARLMVFM